MEQWKFAVLILCLFGFIKELRPSEAFLSPYLKSELKNLTENEVNNQIYPVWTYSYLGALAIVLLTTDLVRHNPFIIFEGVTYIITWSLLIWGEGVLTMQLMQFVYGFSTATEISYSAYIYLVVSVDNYQKLTGFVRAALLCGRCMAGIIGQTVISLNLMNYLQLNYISMTSVGIAFILSMVLPCASKLSAAKISADEAYRERSGSNLPAVVHSSEGDIRTPTVIVEEETPSCCTCCLLPPTDDDIGSYEDISQSGTKCCGTKGARCRKRCKFEFRSLFSDIRSCYTNKDLLKWSLWWAFATCGFFQVGNYGQNLWDEIMHQDKQSRRLYNGVVEAVTTLTGALMAIGTGYLKVEWQKYGEFLLCFVSALDCVCLVVMSQTNNIYLAYGLYVLFRACYQPGITVASFQIASYLTSDRHGLVFGCNTFIALFLETIITLIVVDKTVLNTPVREQFVVYGCYFGVISLVFLVAAVTGTVRRWKRHRGIRNENTASGHTTNPF